MTWFLKSDQSPNREAAPVDGATPTKLEQFTGAARGALTGESAANFASRSSYAYELALEMEKTLGGNVLASGLQPNERIEYDNPAKRGYISARRIGELAQFDNDGRFKGMPTTPDEFDAEVNRRLDQDIKENRAMLARGDNSGIQVAGAFAGGAVQPLNVMTAPFGGPVGRGVGGLAKYMGEQAGLAVAADAPLIIGNRAGAERRGEQQPGLAGELAMSAAGGAAFAGTLAGAGRAYRYAKDRRAASNLGRQPGVSGIDYQTDVALAQQSLTLDQPPRAGTAPSTGISDTYYSHIRTAESGGDDLAKNSKSTASGRYQFLDSTWRAVMRRHPELGLTVDGRFDGGQQERAIRAFTEDNAKILRSAGLETHNANLYAAHFLGAGDAGKVLSAAPDAQLSSLLSPDVIRANPHLRGMAVSDFRAWTARKTGGTGAGGAAFADVSTDVGPTYRPNAPAASWYDQVTSPAGTSVDVNYRVVDLSDLVRASGDLQPRDRSRVSSDEQVADMASRLDPRRLMPAVEADRGAPIVGGDMIVESGNGRVAALRRAATEHPDRYDAYINEVRAAGFEIPEGVKQPVLVAERRGEMDADTRRAWVRENNTSAIARMSATEQAATNADYLTQHAFDAYRPGTPLAAPENADFLRRFFAAMPQAERGPFIGVDGAPTADGMRMIRQTVFRRAFPADDLVRLLAETDSPAVAGLLRTMEGIAPDWAAFRAAVEAGYVRAEFDITDALVAMVRQIAKARMDGRDGQSVIGALRDALATADMFDARDDQLTDALIGIFYKGDRARTPEATQAILQRYLAEAQAVGRADMADLLGDGPTPSDVLTQAIKAQDARAPMPRLQEQAGGAAGELTDLRRLANDAVPEGADARAAILSTNTMLRDLDAPETGPFGTVLRQFEGKPTEAIAELTRRQEGDAIGALTHPETGPIDLVWGEAGTGPRDGFGLSKILRRHPEVVPDIQVKLSAATTVMSNSPNRIRLTNGTDIFVVSKEFQGDAKTWLLTGYEPRRDAQRAAGRSMERADELPEGSSPSAPLRNQDKSPLAADQEISADFDDAEIDRALETARTEFADQPDLEIRLGDGPDAPVIKLTEVLREIDGNRDLLDRMTSCSLKGSPR